MKPHHITIRLLLETGLNVEMFKRISEPSEGGFIACERRIMSFSFWLKSLYTTHTHTHLQPHFINVMLMETECTKN